MSLPGNTQEGTITSVSGAHTGGADRSENVPVFLHPCVALLILMGNARIAGSRDDREGPAVEDRRPQDSRRSDRLAEVFPDYRVRLISLTG